MTIPTGPKLDLIEATEVSAMRFANHVVRICVIAVRVPMMVFLHEISDCATFWI